MWEEIPSTDNFNKEKEEIKMKRKNKKTTIAIVPSTDYFTDKLTLTNVAAKPRREFDRNMPKTMHSKQKPSSKFSIPNRTQTRKTIKTERNEASKTEWENESVVPIQELASYYAC